jgi:hypothetical protein|uniref:Uncharacterized protein n=1 Tax=viral metagenome TaxID=1070528 RepID=A0A6C0KSC0_9ZZZZ
MFQLSPALLDSENNNLIETKLTKKPSSGLNKTLKKKNVEFDVATTKNNDATKNKITSLGNLMSQIHNNSEEDDSYNSTNYQSNLIDETISTSMTDSLNSELAKIQKMREAGNNIPQNTFLSNANNNANALYNLENSNVLGSLNSAKNSLASYNESYNVGTNNQIESPVIFDNNNNKLLKKLDYIIHLLEEQHNEKTNHITEELILYLFLGLFILFVLDSFARASKYRR